MPRAVVREVEEMVASEFGETFYSLGELIVENEI
jgi:hypothetical protein